MPKNKAIGRCPRLGSIVYLVMTAANAPVESVNVAITGSVSNSATTDKYGFVEFRPLEPGKYRIAVTAQVPDVVTRADLELVVSAGDEAFGTATLGEVPPIVFGLQARTLQQLEDALHVGYRAFDGGDTYDDTISLLSAAVARTGIERAGIRIIYKIDLTTPAELKEHLLALANKFSGWIDDVIVHHATHQTAPEYLAQLREVQQLGTIKRVGLGDPDMATLKAQVSDCYELSASTLFENPAGDELAAWLQKAGKPVYVYYFLSTLRSLKEAHDINAVTDSDCRAFCATIRGAIPTAIPILSSGLRERMQANLKAATAEDVNADDYANYKAIEKRIEAAYAAAVVNVCQIPEGLRVRLSSLFGETHWDAVTIPEGERKSILTRIANGQFTDEEKRTIYEGNGVRHRLDKLLGNLQEWKKNCNRVLAYEFLTCAIYS
jgi:diketogulonate reductase-like aldo/keto reductase